MSRDGVRQEREKLRRRVVRSLERPIPDCVWRNVNPDYVEAELEGAQDAFDPLVDDVRRLLNAYRGALEDYGYVPSGPRHSRTHPEVPLPLGAEKHRAAIMAELFAGRARQDPKVSRFRAGHLGGATILPEEVSGVISSAALRYLPLYRLKKLGVPVVGHRSKLGTALLPPAQRGVSALSGEPVTLTSVIEIRWNNVRVVEDFVRRRSAHGGDANPELYCAVRGEKATRISLFPGSFLDDLRLAAEGLSRRYFWREPQVAWFILTDEAPEYVPALVNLLEPDSPLGRIVLTLRPWMSAESVRRIYLHCQKWMLGHRKRAISEAKLQLYQFVESHKHAPPNGPNWPGLFLQWQGSDSRRRKAPPKTWRQFQRDGHSGECEQSFRAI